MALTDFFNELEAPGKEATPSLAEILSRGTKAQLYDTRVCMPAEVLKYDYKKQSVDVQPYFKQTYEDGKTEDMAQIFSVPVAFPRANKAFVSLPLKKGDTVLLVFSDRSIDKWKSTGGKVDPQDKRMHHISDAFAIPGGYSFKSPAPIEEKNSKDLIIQNEHLKIFVKANGHLQIKNQNEELVQLINDMLRIIREAVVYTSNGPQELKHKEFQSLANKLKTFEEK